MSKYERRLKHILDEFFNKEANKCDRVMTAEQANRRIRQPSFRAFQPVFYYFSMAAAWFFVIAIFLCLFAEYENPTFLAPWVSGGILLGAGVVSLAYLMHHFDNN